MIYARLVENYIIVKTDDNDSRIIQRMNSAKRTARMPPNTWKLPMSLESYYQLQQYQAEIDQSLSSVAKRMEDIQRWVERTKTAIRVEPIKLVPIKSEYRLYQHQIKAFNLGVVLNTFAAFLDMGTGKSLTTVAITGRRYLDGKIKRVLIVAPTSVCAVWPREYQQFADFPHRIALILGDREKRLRLLKQLMSSTMPGIPDPLRVAVINYESTWRLQDELEKFKPDMIVCDESQRIKSRTANQSKAMHGLGDMAKYKMILTGTPIQNDTRDVWSQYRFLNPVLFGTRYHAFEARYAIMGGVGNHQYLGQRNLDELIRKAHSIAYRVTKEPKHTASWSIS